MNPSFLDYPLYRVPDAPLPQDRTKGKGQKGIVLLYECKLAEEEVLSPFVDKILQAAKVDREQDALSIRITPGERISLHQLPDCQAMQYCLIFGVKPAQLGLNLQLPAYQPILFSDITFLRADALKSIWEERQEGGKKMSGQLWRALQQLFL